MIAKIRAIIIARPFAAQWSEEQIAAELENKFAVVLTDESVSGFISARAVFETAEIENLAVLPARGRQGVAGELLNRLLVILKQKGVKKVTLEVNERNAPAINFYKKHGFGALGRRAKFYDGADALLMGLDL